MERHRAVVLLLSLVAFTVLNRNAAIDWTTTELSMSGGAKGASASFGIDDLHVARAERRRSLLQVSPAPAPGPGQASVGSSSTVYISYSALSANFVPCPPQTGRSYYTPNCQSATGAVNPYTRGCSALSRCARDSG